MKLSRILLPLVAFAFIFASCKPEEEPEKGLQETITLRSASVQEGAVVSATLDVITLEYNKVVTVAADANITLNGKKLTATKNPGTAMKVDVAVSLEAETDYTLSVPAGAILLKDDANQTAKAFTLHFTTKRGSSGTDEISVNNLIGALGFGWNLGNHFDSFDEGNAAANYKITWNPSCPYWDGVKPTARLYESLAENGIKTVRMCVTWGPYQNMTDGNFTIEEAYINEVAQNVRWALDNGLYVLLNMHHDEYWQDIVSASKSGETDAQIRDRIAKSWTNIATYFKDYDQHLLYETFNELHDEKWGWASGYNYSSIYRLMDQWNQVAVDAIRATGGNNATRWIGVPGFCASPDFTAGPKNKITLPNDPANHIMVAVHSYAPFNFCTEGTVQKWGHTFTGNDNNENEIKEIFRKLRTEFIDKGIPCYMGEFGCETRLDPADEPYRAYFMEYFCRTAYFAGIPVMLWDNNNNNQGTGGGGECFWYVNHLDGTVNTPDLLRTMVNAATSDFTSYTIESIYNNAPK